MIKQIIGLDLDGVIIDSTKNKIKFSKKLGFDLKPEETPADSIDRVLPTDVLSKLQKILYLDPVTALQADLVKGAKIGLSKIKKSKIPYFLISRRKDPKIACELLKRKGLWPDFFNQGNAFFVAKPEDKNVKALELGVNVYIDDQPSVLEKLESIEKRFLFDRFKKFDELPFEHIKVSSWKELLSYLL